MDDDANEPDFDGNFAKVYDSSCEPCMDYNPLEFMKYDTQELGLDDDLQASLGRTLMTDVRL